MNIDISAYRIRIGNFIPVGHSSHKLERKIIRGVYSYKPEKSRTNFQLRKLLIPILLVIFVHSITETYCQVVAEASRVNFQWSTASFFGFMPPYTYKPQPNFNSYDSVSVNVSYGSPTDCNFYARYTYGNIGMLAVHTWRIKSTKLKMSFLITILICLV